MSDTPYVLGHPATVSWCAAVDEHHAVTEGYNWDFCRLAGQDAPPGDIDGALEKLTEIKAQRDDYAERLIKVASVLEPHYRGATPKGTVPTWQWIVKEFKSDKDSLLSDYREEIAILRAALEVKDRAIGRMASSNPHDHGMVVDRPIEGVPGMAAWRLRTNDEWLDIRDALEARIAQLEKHL